MPHIFENHAKIVCSFLKNPEYNCVSDASSTDVNQAPPLLELLDLLFEIVDVKLHVLNLVVVLGPGKTKCLLEIVVETRLGIFSDWRNRCHLFLRRFFRLFFLF